MERNLSPLSLNMKNIVALLILQITASACFAAALDSSYNSDNSNAGCAEFKTDQANLTVNITSNIYTYLLFNQASTAIVGIEIPQHAAYNFKAPDFWEMEETKDSLHAWTDNNSAAILPDTAMEFSMRVSSRGAVLGQKPVKIYFRSGNTISIDNVWVPTAEPRSYVMLVAGMIFVILILHTALVVRRNRRKNKDSLITV
ncbi:MAG TPA: hypothetical protein PLP05_12580 [Sedimentisphaerales bacterium]|nr:hypothetical protein [Sedimentisphaerales bacterium]